MKDEVRRVCETCRHWTNRWDDEGFCQRYAPRPFHKPFDVYWPETVAGDSCGEWEGKETKKEGV